MNISLNFNNSLNDNDLVVGASEDLTLDELEALPDHEYHDTFNMDVSNLNENQSEQEYDMIRQVSNASGEGAVWNDQDCVEGHDRTIAAATASSEDDSWGTNTNRSSIFRSRKSSNYETDSSTNSRDKFSYRTTENENTGYSLNAKKSILKKHSSYPIEDNYDELARNPGMIRTPSMGCIKQTMKYSDHISKLIQRAHIFSEFSYLVSPLKEHVNAIRKGPSDKSKMSQWNNHNATQKQNQHDEVAKRRLKCAIFAFGGNLRSSVDTPNNKYKDRNTDDYEKGLMNQYYENSGRLSWDVEQEPHDAHSSEGLEDRQHRSEPEEDTLEHDEPSNIFEDVFESNQVECEDDSTRDDDCKLKYRCKLCGKPKQNHVCSFQQALERSIGAMVYPVINAFECKEPGNLSSPLHDMNNFTDLIDEAKEASERLSRPIEEERAKYASFDQVTSRMIRDNNHDVLGIKRKYLKSSEMDAGCVRDEQLFMKKTRIRYEQYRVVNESQSLSENRKYRYPGIPLTFVQRSKMSELLFNLSLQIEGLTEVIAQVLTSSRNTKSWDLVIAELITQTIVILHCPPDDMQLEGLRIYLLTLGISS